jgi:hypothetical protein
LKKPSSYKSVKFVRDNILSPLSSGPFYWINNLPMIREEVKYRKMKKVFAILLSASLFMLMAAPAMACYRCHRPRYDCEDCRDINQAHVDNYSAARAFTGANEVENEAEVEDAMCSAARVEMGDEIDTGEARASTYTKTWANADRGEEMEPANNCVNGGCHGGYYHHMMPRFETNQATVNNYSEAVADTGMNSIENEAEVERASYSRAYVGGESGGIDSGDATARTQTWTMVNVSWN